MSGQRTSDDPQQRFVWPPRDRIQATEIETAADTRVVSRRRRGAAWLARFIHEPGAYWLPATATPFDETVARLGWRADDADRYCDRCGASIGPHETDEFGCVNCRSSKPPWNRVVRLGDYHGALATLIKDAKFHVRRTTAVGLGRLLGRALLDAGVQRDSVCVAPVPMWFGRRLARGFDHAAVIAAAVAEEIEAPMIQALAARRRPSQRSVPASQRQANIRGAFRPRRGIDFADWRVVLVDDVMTTGATARQASRALATLGAGDIWVGVVAVTPAPARRPAQDTPAPGSRVETMNPSLDSPAVVGTVGPLASGDVRAPGGVSHAPHTTL